MSGSRLSVCRRWDWREDRRWRLNRGFSSSLGAGVSASDFRRDGRTRPKFFFFKLLGAGGNALGLIVRPRLRSDPMQDGAAKFFGQINELQTSACSQLVEPE